MDFLSLQSTGACLCKCGQVKKNVVVHNDVANGPIEAAHYSHNYMLLKKLVASKKNHVHYICQFWYTATIPKYWPYFFHINSFL